ncbi:MAG: hypothetical protein ACSHX3_13880 [Litorimonas sp.]
MVLDSSTFSALLIDDEIEEWETIQRIFSALTDAPVRIDHAYKCSEAINLLNQHRYDLVLLDNRLSGQISAEFSAPFILSSLKGATVAIISHDIDVAYLKDPDRLGVDFVVDKAKIITFLRDLYAAKTQLRASKSRLRHKPIKGRRPKRAA